MQNMHICICLHFNVHRSWRNTCKQYAVWGTRIEPVNI